MSSLRDGHANPLCAVPVLADVANADTDFNCQSNVILRGLS